MNFRKEWHKSMRLAAVLFSCLMACEGLASAQARQTLRIVVVEGEGAINNVQPSSGQQPVVQVRDDNDEPVAGANVTFLPPERGPGGAFFRTWNKLSVTTDEQRHAAGPGFRPNLTEGRFQILMTAAHGDRTGAVNIAQTNVPQTGGASGGVKPARKFGRGKIIAVLTVAAIIGVVAANRGGNSASATTTTIPGTSIIPGTVSVGPPR